MFNLPYVYRHSKQGSGPGSVFPGELPAKICGVDQAIWMTSRRDTLSGATTDTIAPCLSCVARWKDQSINDNSATLLNSSELAGDTEYWPDYWSGDTTTKNQPFISFDRKTFGTNNINSLNVPSDASFSQLTEFTFSTIVRARQIEPNSVTRPGDISSGLVVLFNNSNDILNRSDGWGIDVQSDELRLWLNSDGSGGGTNATCIGTFIGNGVSITVSDWTEWMRITWRVSGGTMEVNIYNDTEFQTYSGFTWLSGCTNGVNEEVVYDSAPDWFISATKGTGWPNGPGDVVTLGGSWDILEYVLYDEWLPDSCLALIWNYYDFRYDIPYVPGPYRQVNWYNP